jgi:hypothetical protein
LDWKKEEKTKRKKALINYFNKFRPNLIPKIDSSPSEALLNFWEERNTDPEPLKTLSFLLRDINREDAIVILERDLK